MSDKLGSPFWKSALFLLFVLSFQNCSNDVHLLPDTAARDSANSTGTAPFRDFQFSRQFGSYGTGPGQFTGSTGPGLGVNPITKSIYVGDLYGKRINIFAANGAPLSSIVGGGGTADGQFSELGSIAFNPSNQNIIVSDWTNGRVQILNQTGQYQAKLIGFNGPRVAYNPKNGDIIVSEQGGNQVQIFSSNGTLIRKFGAFGTADGQFETACTVAIDPRNDNLVVIDFSLSRIQVFDYQGNFIKRFGSYGSGPGQFNRAFSLAIDPQNGNIIVADQGNHRIQILNQDGVFLSQIGKFGTGPGELSSPTNIAFDPTTREIFVIDSGNWRIQAFKEL